MIKLGVTSTSAVSGPRTTATTTTDFARFRDAAFGAYGTDCHRRDCWCVYVGQNTKTKTVTAWSTRRFYLHGVSSGLTFAGLDALKPPVISVSVASTSTILVPSTARSATTGSA